MAHILVSPTSTFSSVRFHDRSRYQVHLHRRSGLKIFSSSSHSNQSRLSAVVRSSVQPAPSDGNNNHQNDDAGLDINLFNPASFPSWVQTMLKALVLVGFPFYRSMMRLEDSVKEDTVTAVEIVEHTAHLANMIAEGVEDRFEEGTLTRTKIEELEHFSSALEEKARNFEGVVKKIDRIIQKVDTFLEPVWIEGEQLERQIDPQSQGLCPKENDNVAPGQDPPSSDSNKGLLKNDQSTNKSSEDITN